MHSIPRHLVYRLRAVLIPKLAFGQRVLLDHPAVSWGLAPGPPFGHVGNCLLQCDLGAFKSRWMTQWYSSITVSNTVPRYWDYIIVFNRFPACRELVSQLFTVQVWCLEVMVSRISMDQGPWAELPVAPSNSSRSQTHNFAQPTSNFFPMMGETILYVDYVSQPLHHRSSNAVFRFWWKVV